MGNALGFLFGKNVDKRSALMTDTHGGYLHVGKTFARHEMVDHGQDEYVRGDAHSNTVEGYFGILKRGIIGTYHHVSQKHLHRYLAEFDFRYNNRTALGSMIWRERSTLSAARMARDFYTGTRE